MKKVLFAMCFVILLGCKATGNPVQGALDFRTEILQCQTAVFAGQVTCYLGEQSYEFSVDCAYDVPSGDSRVEITSPAELSGIVATTSKGEQTLIYDDVVLALGDGEPAPMLIAKLLGDGLCNGYILYADEEGATTYELADWDDISLQVYFRQEKHPDYIEIYKGNQCILTATLETFQLLQE